MAMPLLQHGYGGGSTGLRSSGAPTAPTAGTLSIVGFHQLSVRSGRKNNHGPARRQVNKQWDKQRRGDSKELFRHWNEQARDGAATPPTVKDFGALSPDQALGQVISAQANFMTVVVERAGTGAGRLLDDDRVRADSSRSADFYAKQSGISVEDELQSAGESQLAKSQDDESLTGSDDELQSDEVERRSVDNICKENVLDGYKADTKLLCVVRALLKKMKRRVMVGDRVLVSGIDWVGKRGMIDEVLERESEISDPPVANVAMLLVLFALDRPRLDPVSLNRFLLEAESTGIPFTVVLNKADLVTEEIKQGWEKRLTEWGYKPYICSVDSGMGLTDLGPLLLGRTSVVFGPSGVGKSSLINALRSKSHTVTTMNAQEQLVEVDGETIRVSEVSHRSGFGRHTTRHVSLVQLPIKGAMLADTPGFSYPSLAMVTSSSLALLFPEVRSRLKNREKSCAFSDCQHILEPDCVVGGDWERYSYYISLWNEMKKREEHEKNIFGTKQESEVRYKTREFGVKQPEPMLLMKKHRRRSRRHNKQLVDDDIWEQRDVQKEMDELKNLETASEVHAG